MHNEYFSKAIETARETIEQRNNNYFSVFDIRTKNKIKKSIIPEKSTIKIDGKSLDQYLDLLWSEYYLNNCLGSDKKYSYRPSKNYMKNNLSLILDLSETKKSYCTKCTKTQKECNCKNRNIVDNKVIKIENNSISIAKEKEDTSYARATKIQRDNKQHHNYMEKLDSLLKRRYYTKLDIINNLLLTKEKVILKDETITDIVEENTDIHTYRGDRCHILSIYPIEEEEAKSVEKKLGTSSSGEHEYVGKYLGYEDLSTKYFDTIYKCRQKGFEKIAKMRMSNEITKEEAILAIYFVPWAIPPDRMSIYKSISRGKIYRDNMKDLRDYIKYDGSYFEGYIIKNMI
jgi:hypothetical protein